MLSTWKPLQARDLVKHDVVRFGDVGDIVMNATHYDELTSLTLAVRGERTFESNETILCFHEIVAAR